MRFPRKTAYSLRTLLLGCGVIGACVGLTARYYVYRSNYVYRHGVVDGFSVKAWWETNHAGKEELVFLLAYPEGLNRGGGESFSPSENPAGYGTGAVHLNPLGIFVHNQKAVAPHGERCWVYLTHGGAYGNGRYAGDVRPIPGTTPGDVDLRVADFETLKDSTLWKDNIYPVLVQESLNFCEEFKKDRGTYPPSRFLKEPAARSDNPRR